MKKLKRITVLLIVMLLSMMIAGCSNNVEEKDTAENVEEKDNTNVEEIDSTVTVTDLDGREVEISLPAERIVLVSARHIHEFSAIMGDSFAEKIVGWGSDLEAYDKDTYNVFLEVYPEIADIPDIGYHSKGTFSVETVISLNPDVVVLPLWLNSDETVLEDIKKMEQAGIPSVFVDFNRNPFDNPVKSMELFGKITGEEERAAEIANFYQEQVDMVADRLAEISTSKPSVYIECASKGPSEYGNTYSGQGWGAMVEKAGGANIADGVIEGSGPINPEYLIKESPEVIILSGSNWEGVADSMKLGFYAEEDDSLQRLTNYTKRAGWDTISAVQTGRVYGIYHGMSFRIYNFAGIQAFAKWFYPEEFEDINPAGNLQEFYNKFMPVELTGVWMTGISE